MTSLPLIGARTQRMVQRVHEFQVLSVADLIEIVWPERCSRQAYEDRLNYWTHHHLIQWITLPDQTRGVRLGKNGMKALTLHPPTYGSIRQGRRLPFPILRHVVTTNQFGLSLFRDVMHDPRVTGVAWFNGNNRMVPGTMMTDARADGIAAVLYTRDPTRTPDPSPPADKITPMLLNPFARPPDGQSILWIGVELDFNTESAGQLIDRVHRWERTWHRWRAESWFSHGHFVLVWIVVAGGLQRLELIRTICRTYTTIPTLLSTVDLLTFPADRSWQPWIPIRYTPDGRMISVWFDPDGHARSLRPWDMEPDHDSMPPSADIPPITGAWAAHIAHGQRTGIGVPRSVPPPHQRIK